MFNLFKYLTSNQDKSRMIYHYNEVATQTTFSKQHCYDKKIKYDITQLQKSSALNPPKIWTTNDDAATQTTAPNRLQSGRSLGLRGRLPPLSTLLSAPQTPPPSSRTPSPSWRLCPHLSEVIIATVQILSSAKVWAVDK